MKYDASEVEEKDSEGSAHHTCADADMKSADEIEKQARREGSRPSREHAN